MKINEFQLIYRKRICNPVTPMKDKSPPKDMWFNEEINRSSNSQWKWADIFEDQVFRKQSSSSIDQNNHHRTTQF